MTTLRDHLRDRATRLAGLIGAAGIAAGVTVALYAPEPQQVQPVDFGPTYTERLEQRVTEDYEARGGECWDGSGGEGRPLPTAVVADLRGASAAKLYVAADSEASREVVADTYAEAVGSADLPGYVQSYSLFCSGGAR